LRSLSELIDGVLRGDRNSVSKAISILENQDSRSTELLRAIYAHTGRAFIIGVTGPPGTGKSTLVDQIVKAYRSRGMKVAVLAIDPTSPLSGGAILGDRIRMLEHALDSQVYIRSMAARGEEGGLARAARNAIRVLDASGNDIVIVETVGIGQAEVEIVKVADIVLVVLMPELGDEIQAHKAGMMEIGDIFVVNKADLPGSDLVLYNLGAVLSTKNDKNFGWKQTALKVSGKTGLGLGELMNTLDQFRSKYVERLKESKMKQRVSEEILETVSQDIAKQLTRRVQSDPLFDDIIKRVLSKSLDPETASQILIRKISSKGALRKPRREKQEVKIEGDAT
jgi:LAO/AO transport system kinase